MKRKLEDTVHAINQLQEITQQVKSGRTDVQKAYTLFLDVRSNSREVVMAEQEAVQLAKQAASYLEEVHANLQTALYQRHRIKESLENIKKAPS
jgi:hypothetical protein